MSKKTLYILIIIILIIAGIFAAIKIVDKDATKPVVANTVNNTNENNNKNEDEQNNTIDIEQNETVNDIEDKNTETNNTEITPEEQAKQIVKEHWGEDDDTVYYSYDGINEQGKYVICVRDKETTKALYRYYVDVETGTCEIE